jgi:YD repeat-containing protein
VCSLTNSKGIGTNLFSNDLIQKVEYPTPSGTYAGQADTSASNDISYTYDLQRETALKTDQNGNVHAYSYDVLGHLTLDAVTTLGSGVDGSIRALGYSYIAMDLPFQQTSYSNSAGTVISSLGIGGPVEACAKAARKRTGKNGRKN